MNGILKMQSLQAVTEEAEVSILNVYSKVAHPVNDGSYFYIEGNNCGFDVSLLDNYPILFIFSEFIV